MCTNLEEPVRILEEDSCMDKQINSQAAEQVCLETDKIECTECIWKGTTKDLLQAPDPFLPSDICYGCPQCKSIDCFRGLCDEPGCTEPSTCGFPVADGYRRTCHKHSAFNVKKEAKHDQTE